jgi:hypothetical protein
VREHCWELAVFHTALEFVSLPQVFIALAIAAEAIEFFSNKYFGE